MTRIAADVAGLHALWARDPRRNPFAAPTFLRAMEAWVSRRETPVWALGRGRDGEVVAAWPLRLDASRTLRLLPDEYSDQSSALAHAAIDQEVLAEGLITAIRETRARRLAFHNVYPEGPTLAAVQLAMRRLGWVHRAFAAWTCPVLHAAGDTPGTPNPLRAEIERHKRVRGYANALRREPGFAFEVIEDARDLAAWTEEFCDAHRARWDDTDTPSIYRSPDARALEQRVLEGWAADGVLVRYAIMVGGSRIALVTALRAGTRLVYYHVVTSPQGERSRAGHVLIRLIGLWMSERGFDTLDFGAGDESYKYRYANAEQKLWRVFGSASPLSPLFVRAVVEAHIRQSPRLQSAWTWIRQQSLRGWLTKITGRRAPAASQASSQSPES